MKMPEIVSSLLTASDSINEVSYVIEKAKVMSADLVKNCFSNSFNDNFSEVEKLSIVDGYRDNGIKARIALDYLHDAFEQIEKVSDLVDAVFDALKDYKPDVIKQA